ncbi:EAL domain-containing protein [Desertifilum sp. FACHB-1129]|uniref:Diguanylate cyclase n=1 Tax=Desertifilum tharense IPPAS B-1220 TaxID=1781255 RepID=A0A1E5QL37_9CYAN|nr:MULTISPECIES: EAL domain-containing protein [Desertifilum]MDA0211754.1 EAL domain-containing protein [Cyanobacteria bacterium FC1]MBD2311984.1 EAL domain-containing protein [Desertifilum sp. FACHB-1129]MBD2322436.1 EAL domain-containing protein [Desertifilum sp. FACHB-866]MBD2332599.1 EAL domain-containing protein [Desertifilum sp. FACHB-868]OEJ75321.1 hypothetical protein BH720_10000 [Desertifilum tharense IPPAS B-1220]
MNWPFLKTDLQRSRKRKPNLVWILPCLPGAIAAVVVAGLFQIGVWRPLEQIAYTALFRLRGPIAWDDRVVVIAIDEPSLKAIGRFPWSRQQYVRLIETLTPAQPSAIVMDLLFPESTPDDGALAEAMAEQGQVILAQSWDDTGAPLRPNATLRQGAIATGHVLKREDADGIARKVQSHIQGVPALGVVAAQVHSLVQEPVQFPTAETPLWVNWPGPVDQIQRYSFIETIQGRVPLENFQNKIVLVGATAATLDSLTTPYNRNPPANGVYLQAAIINNLLRNNFLHKQSDRWLSLILLLGGPGLSYVLVKTLDRYRQSNPSPFQASLALYFILPQLVWGVLSLTCFHWGYWPLVASPIALFTITGGAVIVADQFKTNALLAKSEERYALAVSGSNEGLWDWDLDAQKIYLAPRWKSLLGFAENEIEDVPEAWLDRVHPEDRDRLLNDICNHRLGITPHLENEHRLLHKDGSYRWMLCRGLAVRDAHQRAYRMAGSQTDITERKWAEEQLRYQAYHDTLTNLPNRAFFIDRLCQALKRVQQNPDAVFAVLFLDLDRFKLINDGLGHTVGDQLLVAIAQRLQSCLRPGDIVARLGGDEFTILLQQMHDISDATRVSERIQEAIALPFYLGTHEVFTTSSIGIVLSTIGYQKPEDLLRDADTAMYRAKARGKSCSQIFDKSMHAHVMAQLQLENDLRQAINDRAFQVYYQPIVALKNGQISGFEALVRWPHAERGMISPAEFIPLAEETGLIIALGWWVLHESCRQLSSWKKRLPHTRDLIMSVNLSGVQFVQPNLIERVERILRETELSGSNLKLEITESVVMINGESAVSLLDQLKALEIKLAIDDFGTGYSSFGRLHRLPIHTLKIDRSFVSRMDDPQSSEGWGIVKTIVSLAHYLGLDIVAEGVENQEQLAQLKAMGCEYGQGYFFSRPVDAIAAEALLTHTPHWIDPSLSSAS